MKKTVLLISLLFCMFNLSAQGTKSYTNKKQVSTEAILPGAYQLEEYLPLLKGKRIGIFANQTTIIGNTHLVDSLKKLGVNITKIFAPEHGFRGTADAGEDIKTYTDKQTGVTVVSLYGAKMKPAGVDLADVDILIFDIQDVGVRFYTYISSLQYFTESAIQNNLPLIVLDRPNPNGFYVDGPVLDTNYSSFVGMQPVPVVYGMTIGEYAKMLIGEGWLPWKIERKQDGKISMGELLGFEEERNNFSLTVIKCKNYTHKSRYLLPVKPSPNLPDMGAVYWYPSTCFFEGTVLSEGRGTEHPFEMFGHPKLPDTLTAFKPISRPGATDPKLKDQLCYGWDLSKQKEPYPKRIELKWLIEAYQLFPDKDDFFIKPKKFNAESTDYYFNKLAGNSSLMQQIKQGSSEEAIRKSWQPALDSFKLIRKKYLLYSDF